MSRLAAGTSLWVLVITACALAYGAVQPRPDRSVVLDTPTPGTACTQAAAVGRTGPTTTLAPCPWNGKPLRRTCRHYGGTELPAFESARPVCVVTW